MLRKAVLAAATFLLTISAAAAQSNCQYIATGAVLTAAQWNQCFAAKQNAIPYTTVNKAGDTMTGALVTSASNTTRAGLNIPPGTAPTSPVNGDVWSTSAGLFVQAGGVTYGPIFGTPTGLAHSVLGVAGNATATVASIQGTADQILRITGAGTAAGFGSIDLSKAAAVGTSVLRTVNGGLGIDASGSTGVAIFTAGSAAFQSTMGTGAIARADGSTFTNGTFSGVATITGGSITGMASPTSPDEVATKAYVDAFSGISVRAAVQYATAAVLPNTPSYANGTAGVGRTLTSTGNAALVVDGSSPSVGQRVLVKNQASALQNGVFSVTAAGSGAAQWVITGVTDFDQSAEMTAGATFLVQGGSTNIDSQWSLATSVAAVGTDAVTFNQLSSLSGVLLATNNLSDVTNVATARSNLGLLSMATQAASAVTITGGALNGTLGATTPSSVVATTGNFTSTFNQSGGFAYLGNFNSGGLFPTSAGSGVGIGMGINATSGGLDAAFFNTATSASTSFVFNQMTGASAYSTLLILLPNGTAQWPSLTCSGVGGLAALDSTGVMTCTDFAQPVSGASARQWQTKVGETIAITDFGASTVGSGSTNGTAIANAQAAGYTNIGVPPGSYPTNKNFFGGTDITKQFVGPGQFSDVSVNQRGKWIIPVNTPLTAVSSYGDYNLQYNGDWSKNGIAIEQIITSQIQQTGSLTTSGSTAAANNVLHFSAVPSWVSVGSAYSFRALTATIPTASVTGSISGTTLTVSAALSGAVAIGQTVQTAVGSGVSANTIITGGSGSSWTVNNSQTVGSTTLTLGSPIPAGTVVAGITGTTVTLTNNVNGGGVANGATIYFGANQYQNLVESSPVAIQIVAANGSLGGTGPYSASQQTNGIFINGNNNSAGAGSIWGIDVRCATTAAWASYSSANPFSTPQCGILTGVATAEVNGVYLAPVEWSIEDQGNQSTGISLVLDMTRLYSGSRDHGVLSQFWNGIFLNGFSGTGSKDIDAGIRWGGKYVYGSDYSSATFSGAPIAIAADQKIALNATGGTFGATATGGSSVWYSSVASKIIMTVDSVNSFQLDADGTLILPVSSFGIKFGGVASIEGTVSVRKGDNSGSCGITFKGGIATTSTC